MFNRYVYVSERAAIVILIVMISPIPLFLFPFIAYSQSVAFVFLWVVFSWIIGTLIRTINARSALYSTCKEIVCYYEDTVNKFNASIEQAYGARNDAVDVLREWAYYEGVITSTEKPLVAQWCDKCVEVFYFENFVLKRIIIMEVQDTDQAMMELTLYFNRRGLDKICGFISSEIDCNIDELSAEVSTLVSFNAENEQISNTDNDDLPEWLR